MSFDVRVIWVYFVLDYNYNYEKKVGQNNKIFNYPSKANSNILKPRLCL